MNISKKERAQRLAALRLDPKRVRLAREVIAQAEDFRGGRNGCDDYPLPDYLTAADRRALDLDMCTWNGDPSEVGECAPGWNFLFPYLTAALLQHAAATVGEHTEKNGKGSRR